MNTEKHTEEIIYQWKKAWATKDLQKLIEDCDRDTVFLPFIRRYLPKGSFILEGGCGLGQWVIYLGRQGYRVTGVDIVANCVETCKKNFPDADICAGDVRCLPFSNHCFDGYVSIGVIEHMIEGPETTLREFWRVLKPGGIAVILVPAFNYFMRMWYPIRNFLVDKLRYNQHLRQFLGKSSYPSAMKLAKEKSAEIKQQIHREFWPVIGLDPNKGPIFMEYKYRKNQINSLLKSLNFEILESAPVYHPYVFLDNFGNLFFEKGSKGFNTISPELNACGKIIQKIFAFISPHFFNYCYVYVVEAKNSSS